MARSTKKADTVKWLLTSVAEARKLTRRLRLTGTSYWARQSGSTLEGPATAIWHKDEGGRFTLDLHDGQFHYGVEIGATTDRGCWVYLEDGSEGLVIARLGIVQNRFELNGEWHEDKEVFTWRVVFYRVEVLDDSTEKHPALV